MAYIGRSVDIGMFEKQVLTPNSSTTTFNLNFAVGAANSLLVVYGGVIQEPNVAYSVSGGGQQIVFSEAPATNHSLYIIYLGKQLTTPRTVGQETTKQTFTGDGTTTLFTVADAPVVPAGIMVFVDGILQREGSGNNFVSSGSTINFSAAPDNGAEIDVYTLVKEKVSIDTVADGSITRAKLAASHPYWDAQGNFGIGAALAGAAKLEVTGDTGIAAYITQTGTPTNNAVAIKSDNASTYAMMRLWANQTTGNSIFLRFSTDSNSQVGTLSYDRTNTAVSLNASSNIILNANGTERLRVTSVGTVGINKASPSSLLHISGSSGVNGAAVTLDIGAQQHAWYLEDSLTSVFTIGTGSTSAVWKWMYNSNAEIMRLNTSGKLMLGVSSLSGTQGNGASLVVNNGAIIDAYKRAAASASFYNTSVGNTRNVTISGMTNTGEYWAKLTLVGLNSYTGAGYFTREIIFCGYGGEGRITVISNTGGGPNASGVSVTMTASASSPYDVTAAITFQYNYRCVAHLETLSGTHMYISGVSGTNA